MTTIFDYENSIDEEWDDFVQASPVGNFLHTRKFLSYHGDRFHDRSVYVRDTRGNMVAVFAAAESLQDRKCIISHPGATYGGLITGSKCRGESCVELLKSIVEYYAKQGYRQLIYKAVPYIYHATPCQDDIYALFRMEAERIQSDLSACIDLTNRGRVSSRRKRALKKAVEIEVKIERGISYLDRLWELVTDNLKRKYEAVPVHSLGEMRCLHEKFPDHIEFVVATVDDEVISGVVLFNSRKVTHAQYIASSEKGYSLSGLDAVFNSCIRQSEMDGKQYFDFGTSNKDGGMYLNNGLYEFKAGFGAGGVVYDRFAIQLDRV